MLSIENAVIITEVGKYISNNTSIYTIRSIYQISKSRFVNQLESVLIIIEHWQEN